MLKELKIQHLAIIDHLSVTFDNGLTVISGETGAGKSIIIGAVGLLLGDRASADLIRSAEESATVEALFDVHGLSGVRAQLIAMGHDDADELVIKRIVSRSGKNKVYVNGHPVTLGMLTKLSESLVNVCSQHEHQTLLNAETHIDILDEFGDLLGPREEYSALYREYLALCETLRDLNRTNDKRHEQEEFLRFQLKEIEDGDITVGEDGSLADEKQILSNAKRLSEYSERALAVMYAGEDSVLEKLTGVIRDVSHINEIDPRFTVAAPDLESLFYNLEEASFALRDYVSGIVFDSERLEVIDDRLEYLQRMKRKYGGGTLEGVIVKKDQITEALTGISSLEEKVESVSRELVNIKRSLLEIARDLSQQRHMASYRLKEAIEAEIHTLRMPDTTFEVYFQVSNADAEGDPSLHSKGFDVPEFYISTNVGEELKPLNRIASGGELSRIVLAMKKVLARTGDVGTIIFDEVDAGIGGATAEIVGKKLQEVSRHHQVICISHLPQIVCFGENHYRVAKHVTGNRTSTEMHMLAETERVEELTRMLGGVTITEKTREHACEMLKTAHEN